MATEKSNGGSTIVGRQELTRRIASEAKLTQKQASQVLETTLITIREALQSGNEVRLVGFGSSRSVRVLPVRVSIHATASLLKCQQRSVCVSSPAKNSRMPSSRSDLWVSLVDAQSRYLRGL